MPGIGHLREIPPKMADVAFQKKKGLTGSDLKKFAVLLKFSLP